MEPDGVVSHLQGLEARSREAHRSRPHGARTSDADGLDPPVGGTEFKTAGQLGRIAQPIPGSDVGLERLPHGSDGVHRDQDGVKGVCDRRQLGRILQLPPLAVPEVESDRDPDGLGQTRGPNRPGVPAILEGDLLAGRQLVRQARQHQPAVETVIGSVVVLLK